MNPPKYKQRFHELYRQRSHRILTPDEQTELDACQRLVRIDNEEMELIRLLQRGADTGEAAADALDAVLESYSAPSPLETLVASTREERSRLETERLAAEEAEAEWIRRTDNGRIREDDPPPPEIDDGGEGPDVTLPEREVRP